MYMFVYQYKQNYNTYNTKLVNSTTLIFGM